MTCFHLTENIHFLQYRDRTRCVGPSLSLSPSATYFSEVMTSYHDDVTAALTSPPLPYVTIQDDLVSLPSNFAFADSFPSFQRLCP